NVLIVEDDDVIQEKLHRMFEQFEHAHVAARSSREALAALSRDKFDMVISSYALPDGNGAALLNNVKTEMPKALRCLISEGRESDYSPRTWHIFMGKPFSIKDIEVLCVLAQRCSSRP